jgi:hypothetical protein
VLIFEAVTVKVCLCTQISWEKHNIPNSGVSLLLVTESIGVIESSHWLDLTESNHWRD